MPFYIIFNIVKKVFLWKIPWRLRWNGEVFVKNNRTSGGVCDNCLHNTEGNNCERCKKNFYRDTSVPIDSPFTCKRK